MSLSMAMAPIHRFLIASQDYRIFARYTID
jgi:hypothetical protein